MTVNSALVNTILVQAPPSYRKASDRLYLPAEVALTGGPAEQKVWKTQVWKVPCLKKAVLLITQPVKGNWSIPSHGEDKTERRCALF